MNDQLRTLGDAIGDILMQLEIKAIGPSKDRFYIDRIRSLFDSYAKQFDEVLSKRSNTMFKELKKLMQHLITDLEKITVQESRRLIQKTQITKKWQYSL
jgi:hypothetical protein